MDRIWPKVVIESWWANISYAFIMLSRFKANRDIYDMVISPNVWKFNWYYFSLNYIR